jgi:hypothetical protein
VEGRHGLAILAEPREPSLVTGRRSLEEGRWDAADEGLLRAITPGSSFVTSLLLTVVPPTLLVAALGFRND